MSKWLMNGDEYEYAYDVAMEIADNLDDGWFEEQIYNDYGDEVVICDFYFDTIDALRRVSMSHYDELKEVYRDNLVLKLKKRFDRMTYGDITEVLGYEVKFLGCEGDE